MGQALKQQRPVVRSSVISAERSLKTQEDKARARNAALGFLFDVLILSVLSAWFCFYDLGGRSLAVPDEVVEVQAGQEMFAGGSWMLPSVDGEAFFDKPPFKMWLTQIPVRILGPSNFSYRSVDASAGVLTILLTYLFARVLVRSRLAGVLAGVGMLGCEIYVSYHGVRTAVQDSLLIFLHTIALFSAWKMLRGFEMGRRSWGAALIGGLAVGCAILTKSAAGLLAPIMVAVFCVLGGELRTVFSRGKGPVLLVLLLAAAIPGSFYLSHCLFTPGACNGMLYHHVYGRVVHGYHNVGGPWFYLIRVFEHGASFPPLLIAAGLLFGLWRWLIKKETAYLFLLVWAVLPVVLFSLAKTKLSWYIAPGFPAMGILIGAVVAGAWVRFMPKFRKWWSGEERAGVVFAFFALFVLGSVFLLGRNLHAVAQGVLAPKERIAFDETVQSLLASKQGALRVVSYDAPEFSLEEKPYGLMLYRVLKTVSSEEEVLSSLREKNVDFVITKAQNMYELAGKYPLTSYTFLSPLRDRKHWMAVLGYTETTPEGFIPWKKIIDFGAANFKALYGFGDSGSMGDLRIRWSEGSESGFLVQGDFAMARLGSQVFLNFAPHADGVSPGFLVSVLINGVQVAELSPAANQIDTYEFSVPPGVWKNGQNAVVLSTKRRDGQEIPSDLQLLMCNWISIRLRQ